MDPDREARIAANEALFRNVNEKIEDLNTTFATLTDTFMIVCECGLTSCTDQFEVDPAVYEETRSDPALFMVVPGHEIEAVEDVVAKHDGFEVVRKKPGPSEDVAVATDPRS